MLYLDKYAYSNSLRRLHPVEKFFFALSTMIICLIANSLTVSVIVVFLMSGVAVRMGKIPLRFYLKLMLIPTSFLTVGIITIAINIVDDLNKLLWGWQIFNITIGITTQSLHDAIKLLLRSLAAISCLYFLSLTTPSVEIISILRKLKFPELFLDLMSLVYRFLFVLLEAAEKIYTSQTVRLGYVDLKRGYRSLGQLVVNLFIQSCRRSMDLYTALEARGYNGKFKVLEQEYRFSKKSLLIIFITEVLLIIIGGGSH